MEEKLNELLEQAEIKIIQYEEYRHSIIHKMRFAKEHNFLRELQWLQYEKEKTRDLFYDYKESIEKIRELLNKWNS